MTRTDKTEIDGLFSTLKEMSEMAAKTRNMVDNPTVRKYIQDAIKDAEDTQTYIIATLKSNFRYLFLPDATTKGFVDIELTTKTRPGSYLTVNESHNAQENWFWFSVTMEGWNIEGGLAAYTNAKGEYKVFINPDKASITRIGTGAESTIYAYKDRFQMYLDGSGQTTILRNGVEVCVKFNDIFNSNILFTETEWNDLKDRADRMKLYTQHLVGKYKEWVQGRIQKVSETINESDRAKTMNEGCSAYVPVEK